MEPTTLAIISSVVGAVGAVGQANAAAASAKSQKQAAEYNATVMKQQAVATQQQGAVAEDAQRRRVRSILGKQRAALAESGLGFEGTGGMLLNQSAAAAELDALNMRYETDLRAKGLLSDANMAQFEGEAALSAGRSAAMSGYLTAGTSLLSGVANYAGSRTSSKPVLPSGAKASGNYFAQTNSLRYRY